MTTFFKILSLLFLFFSLMTSSSYACSCFPPDPPQVALQNSNAVFVGTVIDKQPDSAHSEYVVTFRVTMYWKGVKSLHITLRTNESSAACGYWFEQDSTYLVYAVFYNGSLRAHLCTRTQSFSNASFDLSELGPSIEMEYFPLHVGDRWTYTNQYDTTYHYELGVFDTVNITGAGRFFLYGQQDVYAETLANDSNGNIIQYMHGKTYLWFDFSRDSGTFYKLPVPFADTTIVHVRKNLVVDCPLGYFSDCADLFFDVPSYIDEEMGYTFAPGVGIVHRYGAWTDLYLLHAVINGVIVTDVKEGGNVLPTAFKLYPNFPNPFNPGTRIKLDVPVTIHIMLKVYNVLGQEVAALLDEIKLPGSYEVVFDGAALPSGIYFCRVSSEKFNTIRKLVLMK